MCAVLWLSIRVSCRKRHSEIRAKDNKIFLKSLKTFPHLWDCITDEFYKH